MTKAKYASILLFSVANATFTKMEEHFEKLKQDAIREGGVNNRNVGAYMGASINVIDGYGCWCYFSEGTQHLGRSNPVNEVDAYCKVLRQGYQCAVMDYQEENPNATAKI